MSQREPTTPHKWSGPGVPPPKTFSRAGSPNHQDDSKESPMVTPNVLVAGMSRLGKGSRPVTTFLRGRSQR